MKIIIAIAICLSLAGCATAELKEGGLYVNKDTCVGMDDFGVGKVNQKF